MKNLTVHQRINFKSHYPAKGFERIKRVDHYGHDAHSNFANSGGNQNYKSFDIPFWHELQPRLTQSDKGFIFLSKF